MSDFLQPELLEAIILNCGNIQKRRFIKEIEYLITDYSNISISFNYASKTPIVMVKDKENEIKMILHERFPFKGPEVEVNSMPYSKIIIITDAKIKQNLKAMLGITCLCCESFICDANWLSHITLKDVVNEVVKNIKIRGDLNNYIDIDTNIDDINNFKNLECKAKIN